MLSQKQILDLLFEGEIKKETNCTNLIITGATINDKTIGNKDKKVYYKLITFNNCVFLNCHFNALFNHCNFTECEFYKSDGLYLKFEYCKFDGKTIIAYNSMDFLRFENTTCLGNLRFYHSGDSNNKRLEFSCSSLKVVNINHSYLDTKIHNSQIREIYIDNLSGGLHIAESKIENINIHSSELLYLYLIDSDITKKLLIQNVGSKHSIQTLFSIKFGDINLIEIRRSYLKRFGIERSTINELKLSNTFILNFIAKDNDIVGVDIIVKDNDIFYDVYHKTMIVNTEINRQLWFNENLQSHLYDKKRILKEMFETNEIGIIVYKIFGRFYLTPDHWEIKADNFIEDFQLDHDPRNDCSVGINVATREWIGSPQEGIWKCIILWEDIANVVVPYFTTGKIRCKRLKILNLIPK